MKSPELATGDSLGKSAGQRSRWRRKLGEFAAVKCVLYTCRYDSTS